METPNVWQWVSYAYGRRLPNRYREWVLHNSTDRSWLWRYTLLVVAQTLPWLVAAFALLTVFTRCRWAGCSPRSGSHWS